MPLRVLRQRCWWHPFVLDLDIRVYCDSKSHELLLLLYIGRWRKSAVQLGTATLNPEKGTPQGSVVNTAVGESFSPLCVRHVDAKKSSEGPVRAYADDILCHCDSERQAQELKAALVKRFAECGLELNPDKTIVRMKTGEVIILNRESTFWPHVLCPLIEEPFGKALRQLHSRCQQCREEGNPTGNPCLATTLPDG